jgi:chaperonin GroES
MAPLAVSRLAPVMICDRVLFGKWSGSEVKIDGEELAIMKESDIFGVVEGK